MENRGNVTAIINRLLYIFLLFSLIVTVGSFILRHAITVKLDRLSSELRQPAEQARVSGLLLDLDIAENSFQKASSDGTRADLADYHQKTDKIFKEISAIIDRYQTRADTTLPGSRAKLSKLLQQKFELSRRLFSLRKNFDSLVRVTTTQKLHNKPVAAPQAEIKETKTDSVVSTRQEVSKMGLLRRLKDAFRPTQSVKVITLKQKSKEKVGLSTAGAKALLAELGSQYGRIAQSGQALVLANLNLLTSLRQVIRQLEDIDRISYEQSREKALKAYASTTRDLNTFSGVALVAMLVFISLLLVYVRRAAWAERRLRIESKRAIRLATQKSEILAIMSHEIRNKLMAINGAVYTLRRSSVSPQQEQKLSTITLATGLVLETVNNVLDVSKLEQGYAENRKSGPFIPAEAVNDAAEAMRFMAENKGLELALNQGEKTGNTVIGDSFKLKQVLLNLLSNAIKYTESGGVFVSTDLTDGLVFVVKIKDTGAGIPVNEQARLFTPYYQAHGHKPGTGLGLYLCRELISNQEGEINLESEEGKGTLITFKIPYTRFAH